MRITELHCLITLCLSLAAGTQRGGPSADRRASAVPGAKPVTVEHIKIHGAALEGNLEGDAVDREVFVFLPPSYQRTSSAAIRWCTRCTAIRSGRSNGGTRSTCRRPSKARSPRARRK